MATESAVAGFREVMTSRVAVVSRGTTTVALVPVTGMTRVGLMKIVLWDLSTPNSERRPCRARYRAGPDEDRAARISSRSISAREPCPCDAPHALDGSLAPDVQPNGYGVSCLRAVLAQHMADRTCDLPRPPRSGCQSCMSSITVSLISRPRRRHNDPAKRPGGPGPTSGHPQHRQPPPEQHLHPVIRERDPHPQCDGPCGLLNSSTGRSTTQPFNT